MFLFEDFDDLEYFVITEIWFFFKFSCFFNYLCLSCGSWTWTSEETKVSVTAK